MKGSVDNVLHPSQSQILQSKSTTHRPLNQGGAELCSKTITCSIVQSKPKRKTDEASQSRQVDEAEIVSDDDNNVSGE